MAFHKVLFIGKDLEAALAPYDENNENYFRAVNHIEHYRLEYENGKDDENFLKEYPKGTFQDFLKYYVDIPTIKTEEKAEWDSKKKHYALEDEDGEVVAVNLFINPNTQFSYYEIVHDFKGYYDYRSELEGEKKIRRKDWKSALKILGRAPKFESWDNVIKKALDGKLGEVEGQADALEAAQDFYYGQPDREKLASALPYVEDCIGSSENEREYVSHASLPYYAILTDDGWFSQVRGSYYMGIIAEPLSDKEWLKLQIELVKRATSIPDYKAYILTTRI